MTTTTPPPKRRCVLYTQARHSRRECGNHDYTDAGYKQRHHNEDLWTEQLPRLQEGLALAIPGPDASFLAGMTIFMYND